MSDKLQVAGAVATKAAYTASGSITFFGVFTAQEAAAIFGMLLGFITLASNIYINWYWRKKAHELELEKLKYQRDDNEDHPSC